MITRRSFIVSIGACTVASAASAQYFDLGNVWLVREQSPDGQFWEGEWVRRGPRTFAARWRNAVTGAVLRDVIDITRVSGGSVVLYRRGNNGNYFGDISADGRRIRGTASWYQPGAYWTAQIR